MLPDKTVAGTLTQRQGNHFSSMVQMVRHQAAARPEQAALIFLRDGEVEAGRLTYGELDRRARAFAARLQAENLAGQPVLLMLPSGIHYVLAFLGCLYAKAIPVPAYPATGSMHAERLAQVVNDCHAKGIVLATASLQASIQSRLGQFLSKELTCSYLAIDESHDGDERNWIEPDIEAGDLAYLQYTSGSTSQPRGVMVTHGNLLAYCRSWQAAAQQDHADVFVTWLPLFHDMGLILGVIQPLFTGATIVMMPPPAFLQRPLRWLEAISKYRGTISYAPNFAYELCAAALDQAGIDALDLSAWSVAGNAAEPVHADTLDKFAARFGPRGYRAQAMNPSYGLAEATLTVTSQPRLHPPRVIEVDPVALAEGRIAVPREGGTPSTLVGCGRTWLGNEVIAVDPASHRQCADGEVGEIWVRGPLVAKGYWNRPGQNKEIFQAMRDTGEGPYLRTGDLGVWSDGELYITGRIKDVIIIRGQNHYPQDIEHTIHRAHSALALGHGAAFSVEVGGVERLVVVQEVRRSQRNKIDGKEVAQAIRAAIAEVHGLPVYAVLLLKPASVHITSSGKIQRQACKKSFLDDEFETLHAWCEDAGAIAPDAAPSHPGPSRQAIAGWMTERIAQAQKISAGHVLSDMPFTSLGLDSLQLVALTGDLAAWLKIPIEPTLLYSYPNIDSLARHLSGQVADQPRHNHVGIKPSEPIAVVGIACRFPKANSLGEYWQLLDSGADAITEVPPSRWDAEAYYQPGPPAPGKASTKWGGFIDGVDEFDAQFFGISPREANGMDPQQRLLLQTTWHALEDAGMPPDALAGSDTGVFVGVMTHDYELLEVTQNATLDAYFGTGTHASIVANRISYLFDLHGPSWTMETACSSSLVALHSARASLLAGECGLAIVGGVNTLLSPELFVALSQAQMLSPSGRCMSFDARANGYVRSEGSAVLILKRYSDALRDNNRIHGVIAASAVNQDGKSNGITAPNGEAQKALIRRALAVAGVTPDSVSYVEAHGTGTGLGDPIEMDAIKHTYGTASTTHPTLWVGSAKSNIGHTEPVSGLAGMIKVMLAMRHERIPQNVHFQQLNPHISLEGGRCAVAAVPQPWPRGDHPRLAAVSSFGFGGANAHLILQEPPAVAQAAPESGTTELLTLSARSGISLRQSARDFARFLSGQPSEQCALRTICHTANAHRAHLAHRVAAVGRTPRELADALEKFARNEETGDVQSGSLDRVGGCKTAWLFTGQGAQYRGMGQGLYRSHALFRQTLAQCDRILQPLLNASLIDALYGGDETAVDLTQTMYAQPALFAVEYALACVWQSSGMRPDYLIGHSLGEYVAACIAGVFSLEDGLKLVAHRGRLMQTHTEPGAMIAIRAPAETMARLLAEFAAAPHPELALAAQNTAGDIVISGAPGAAEALAAQWVHQSGQSVTATPLQVTRAFHSPLMRSMLAEFERIAREVRYSPPAIPVISNVTGRVAGAELADPLYWVEHICKPVGFMQGMQCLQDLGCGAFVEIGPHPVLTSFGKQTAAEGLWLPSLRRGFDDEPQLLSSLAGWHVNGGAVDWTGWARGRLGEGAALPQPASLPHYPFQKDRYWFTPGIASASAHGQGALPHPLLGRTIDLPRAGAHRFGNQLSAGYPWFIEQHKGFGVPLLPMAGMIETALAAVRAAAPAPMPEWTVTGLEIKAAMAFDAAQRMELQTVVERDAHHYRVDLLGRYLDDAAGGWREYASACIHASYSGAPPHKLDVAAAQSRLAPQSVDGFYERCRKIGLDYGPGLQGLQQLWLTGNESLARIEMQQPASAEADKYHLHPAMLDACFHVAIPFMERIVGGSELALLPMAFERLTVYRKLPRQAWAYCVWHGEVAPGRYAADLKVCNASGERVLSVRGMQLALGSRNAVTAAHSSVDDEPRYYRTTWLPFELPATPAAVSGERWLVLCRDADHARDITMQCERDGIAAIVVTAADAFGWHDEHQAALNWHAEPDWKELFAALRQRGAGLDGLLLYAGDEAADPDTGLADRTYGLSQSVFLALKHFLSAYGDANPAVVICTRGAVTPDQVVNDGERLQAAGLMQGVLNGMAKSIVMEFPFAKCVQVDLDPASGALPLPMVMACVRATPGSVQLALRGERVLQARLAEQPRAALPMQPLPVRPDATYLVTGGLRGVGLASAQWLASQGARFLALSGRTIPPESGEAIRALEASGVKVAVMLADVADAAALEQAMHSMAADMPPLRGVLHSAGLTEDAALIQTDWGSFARVMDPKVKGAWHLHRLTAGMPIDFFVLFSSMTSQVGNAGQVGYIAACAFLDSLAHYRRQHGLPATSINWGYWSETGVAMRRDLAAHMAHMGVGGIANAQGMQGLARLAGVQPVQCGALLIDWARFKRVMCPGLPYALLADLGGEDESAEQAADAADAVSISPELIAGLKGEEARALILCYLLERATRVLRLDAEKKAAIAPDFARLPFNRLGFDSLMSIEMRTRIRKDLSVDVPLQHFLAGSSAGDVADLIHQQIAVSLLASTAVSIDASEMEEALL
ncbi:type I polyketide synthase [Pseudoduganella namucuonensis]|uniref:Acyl transferase domain-containing protein n=1 Tax=Pseudoduganella namucuonensis TaxID=1035707 RepID=A0A1I7FKJ9_9BURK|nr:type I polyketide synthase [Pseudoduganella namucuonensis]SFU36749.1 Acyl transferase domain-containing protein [Pseudoduganella namucuonensis]